MATATIAPAPTERTVPEETAARALRGLALYRERGEEIVPKPAGGVSVPSSTGERSYRVSLVGEGRCGCPDYHKRRRPCKHIYAATIARAKGRIG